VGLESRGCKREPRKVLDVGVGNAEGERMGEMLKRRGERERQIVGLGWQEGITSPCLPLPLQGLWTEQ
jgi:hypothetical protein